MIGQTPSLSFEIFPPKPEVGNEKIIQALDEMQGLAPHFISVTCSNNNLNIEETTVRLVNHIRNELGIPTIAHLPAAYLTKDKVKSVLQSLDEVGVHHILALRGDIIDGLPPKEDFRYATDLISFIKQEAPHFDIIGACYPEVHPESPNSVSDIKNLKKKVDAGCSSLVTQLFFDNEAFYEFQEKCHLADIEVPIIAGIMPIINRNQALRLLKTCENIRLPRKFKAILEKYEHSPDSLRAAGLAYAVDQIVDLVTNDVAGVHLYTMNNAETARYIHQATHSLFNHYQGSLSSMIGR
ncbi:TPA: methylenetetrahydrofolate reductase [NAD(P)H] [Streptococcus suis]|uniref:Methylenetetrahydrofolate reductase n=1 Tax=Streptococcus iners subsp. hyiners TaxID=3028083 RepID=A0AA97A1M6_9STRE|nr:methylenetetrahydrofolate reductase [NAD(P)H] [Streptococcus sp. 29892]MCK4028711.1 methylenetetrahydrofolate reductase [NAD(P)H] [Streptococcus suis]WNY48679.1 methylenetetrahydrofolate reductase [NAD(P)H] [Streptococcus sp. 29892]HEM5122245.1 methylenetetrahydrofolate reductase [NAD(P)H] [Streptococcus suis]